MINLQYSHDRKVDAAYIITVKSHTRSEEYAQRCANSCEKSGMPYKIWHAYDGTSGEIIAPDHLKNDSFMNILKVTDNKMTPTLISCTLSHISLWLHCAVIDRPIVILEHDAVFVRPFEYMESLNSIVYLGNRDYFNNVYPLMSIPILGSEGQNNRYMYCAHAYAIDPMMAKNLLSHVLQTGIYSIPDRMMRADLFNICHQGLYAYEDPFHAGDTTVIPINL